MNRSSKYKSAESIWIFFGIIQCFVGVCDKLDFFAVTRFRNAVLLSWEHTLD